MHNIKPLLVLLSFIVSRVTALTVEDTEHSLQENTRLPLRIAFSEPMVPMGNQQNYIPSGLTIATNIKGIWSWGSQSTLLFTPDEVWQAGNEYTVTIPSGIVSAVSGNKLKRKVCEKFRCGKFTGNFTNYKKVLSTSDPIQLFFSLEVETDSLRKYIRVSPEGLDYTINRSSPSLFTIQSQHG
ncbi:MAG TPA: Ig-like domain-containing protein [Chitinispirillaceae bacterium]|nr:Ig-like domain-containing protein [Chitinispirillaceae bacterium]